MQIVPSPIVEIDRNEKGILLSRLPEWYSFYQNVTISDTANLKKIRKTNESWKKYCILDNIVRKISQLKIRLQKDELAMFPRTLWIGKFTESIVTLKWHPLD